MKLVVVESPAKAKTINKYLGSGYLVVASMGHVRDIPSKNNAIDPKNGFSITYEIKDTSKRHVKTILDNAKKSEAVLLASDPDREGEAISWHIAEMIKEAGIKVEVKRVSFSEITKQSVLNAIKNPREIDVNLVEAQQARRALDYFVGFGLSPVLWRRLPGSKSAGRVQSVALRLIAERELEIKAFISHEYWSVPIALAAEDKTKCLTEVHEYNDKKFSNTFPKEKKDAELIAEKLRKIGHLKVEDIQEKNVNQNPVTPFTTSLLQQEASKKLGFSGKKTMQIAQTLYEGVDVAGVSTGIITYMRTDGMSIANDAISSIRKLIIETFGDSYLPKSPVIYKTKAKNAQEAHEAIRPTDICLTPKEAEKYLSGDEVKLYKLIWERTVACQMKAALKSIRTVTLVASSGSDKIVSKISTTNILFDGFLKVYKIQEENDKDGEDGSVSSMPLLTVGQILKIEEVSVKSHNTIPPPRFTEAALIKKMEEMGIGRPSTYVTIISLLQDRGYVKLEKKRFVAEVRGMIVTTFLMSFFSKYVEYDFTANLEDELDLISAGELQKLSFLDSFWSDFDKAIESSKVLKAQDTIASLTSGLSGYFFADENGKVHNKCPTCNEGVLNIDIGKFGPYIKCERRPDCGYVKNLSNFNSEDGVSAATVSADAVEIKLENGHSVVLKKGIYGNYVEVFDDLGKSLKKVSIAKDIAEINDEVILFHSKLPFALGNHPELGEVVISIGKFGPYVLCGGKYYNVSSGSALMSLDLDGALQIISTKPTPRGRNSSKISDEDAPSFTHPESGEKITVHKGKYGVYIKYQGKNYSIKSAKNIEEVDLEKAVDAVS